MSKPIEIDWQTRQQIAFWAAVFGAIAAVMMATGGSSESQTNPLVAGFVGFVLSFVVSLISRAVGVVIILIGSILILRSCGGGQ